MLGMEDDLQSTIGLLNETINKTCYLNSCFEITDTKTYVADTDLKISGWNFSTRLLSQTRRARLTLRISSN
jgi:hypothetical protein